MKVCWVTELCDMSSQKWDHPTSVNSFTSGGSVVKEAQPSMHRCNLGISGQAVEVIWTAHPGFDSIQSWQPAFVLACE